MTTEPEWVQHALWWRLYPLGFVGSVPQPSTGPVACGEHRLRRVIAWLDHVVELGLSGVALGPVFASTGHGYDTVDHRRVDARLGDDDDLDELITQAHRRGLRVQLDGVFNHVSREHPLVADALRDGRGSAAGSWVRWQGEREPATFEGHDNLIALDHSSPEVAEWVVDIMRHWLDRGADAWRLDAAYSVPTEFWAEVLPQVRHTHPQVWFEAEVLHGDYSAFVRDSTAHSATQYELWKAIWSSLHDRNFFELDHALTRHNEMLASFAPTTFMGNHDVTRIATQVGDRRHLPHAVVLLMLLGGVPTVYAGDEYAFDAVKEDRVGGDDAIRPEFPADGPASLEGGDEDVLRLHQDLIGLRRRHAWLHRATTETSTLRNEQYEFGVGNGDHRLHVVLNLDDDTMAMPDGEIVAADDASREAGRVQGHGWAVLDPAGSR